MTSGYMGPEDFGRDPFGDFIARFLGGAESPGGSGRRRDPRYYDFLRLMSEPARELVSEAASYAAEHGSSDLDTEHLLRAALTTEPTRTMIDRAGADVDALARNIDREVGDGTPRKSISVSPAVKRALLDAHDIARTRGASYIGSEHVLIALAANRDSTAGQILNAAHFDPRSASSGPFPGQPGQGAPGYPGAQGAGGEGAPGRGQQGKPPRTETPNLDKYGTDLTEMARDGRIDPVIGRDVEIEQTIEILARRGKNNPVLIGEAGVGKTAIVEGLAQRIMEADVPDNLVGRRVVQLDVSGVVAGTRYRGDFEERLNGIIDEIREHSEKLIIFIDELHNVVGAGGGGTEGGSMDAGNMLKPPLSRGELHVIGATTLEEHRRYIEKDAALARRFQPVLVPEPSVPDAVEILRGLRDRYEAHHQVRYTGDALIAAVELSDRYLTGRYLPDKAIDLLDQAGARVRLRNATRGTDVRALEREAEQINRDKDQAVAAEDYERATQLRDRLAEVEKEISRDDRKQHPNGRIAEVTVEDIADIVSRQTGIPVSNLTQEEKERLLGMEERLRERVIGQDEAVSAVSDAVLRSRAGLSSPSRPIGSFLFLGPTGVGKTELARALAESLFGTDDRMVRLDMSEYQERHTVSRLVGAPPGYVGHEDAGQLTETVRRNPYSLLLLDEIEKAHADVFNMLLQVLDDGRLTDSQGRTVDFTNTVVVMTSNLGSEAIAGRGAGIGFGGGDEEDEEDARRERVMRPLREHFRPEFLNRIDEIVIFRRLSDEELRTITDMMLDETRHRVHAQDLAIEFAPAAIDWLVQRGYQPEYGARPLRRTIQREVDNQLSRMLLSGELKPHTRLLVDVESGELVFRTDGEQAAQVGGDTGGGGTGGDGSASEG
ncbi:ATP-dependent Clp protease ATP-binding subunit [Streptomyces sp. HNM0575]|uniref:ATP-dependent Clp protease ATP-binding subunit n=1 Tax=Streptomyces sp. HNM0575 TaxID=2716338 RepID=UPI00145F6992|nr:ATP-dependent Clp protease ATP-binding subunit [Streptomyces sp. HNM0575]NLU72971.1 ATP-dependent Clp protease ATP-binding subunit [Streptomyces sp. HNM0575]